MTLDIGVYGARGIPSTYSGFETFLTELLPTLAARGHRVTMYCRRGEVPPVEDYRGVHLRHTPVIATKNLSTLTHGLATTVAALRGHHDVLLAVNVANAPYCGLATRAGLPVVLNVDGQEWLRGKWGRVARTWFYRSAKMAGRSATALVADGVAMRQVYLREFRADATVIPYSYTPTRPDAITPDHLADYGLEPRRYFVTGGRMVPENNIDAIVERYIERGSDLPIAVLGAANYESPVVRRLRELAARDGRVKILGHVAGRASYFSLLHYAVRYLHGHSVGGTNPSLIEAMGVRARVAALATPFNCETLGGAGEFFTDVGDSLDPYLTPPTDDDEAHRIRAHDRAENEFRLDEVADAYEELLVATAAARARDAVRIDTRWSRSRSGAPI